MTKPDAPDEAKTKSGITNIGEIRVSFGGSGGGGNHAASGTQPNAAGSCGAPAIGGRCVLPAGHNMGKLDIPRNHQAAPDAPTPRTCACCNDDCHSIRRQLESELAAAKAQLAEFEQVGKELADAAYSTCCGANGIYDNTWRNKDGGEVVPDFPHGGFSESINRLGKAQNKFKKLLDDARKGEKHGTE